MNKPIQYELEKSTLKNIIVDYTALAEPFYSIMYSYINRSIHIGSSLPTFIAQWKNCCVLMVENCTCTYATTEGPCSLQNYGDVLTCVESTKNSYHIGAKIITDTYKEQLSAITDWHNYYIRILDGVDINSVYSINGFNSNYNLFILNDDTNNTNGVDTSFILVKKAQTKNKWGHLQARTYDELIIYLNSLKKKGLLDTDSSFTIEKIEKSAEVKYVVLDNEHLVKTEEDDNAHLEKVDDINTLGLSIFDFTDINNSIFPHADFWDEAKVDKVCSYDNKYTEIASFDTFNYDTDNKKVTIIYASSPLILGKKYYVQYTSEWVFKAIATDTSTLVYYWTDFIGAFNVKRGLFLGAESSRNSAFSVFDMVKTRSRLLEVGEGSLIKIERLSSTTLKVNIKTGFKVTYLSRVFTYNGASYEEELTGLGKYILLVKLCFDTYTMLSFSTIPIVGVFTVGYPYLPIKIIELDNMDVQVPPIYYGFVIGGNNSLGAYLQDCDRFSNEGNSWVSKIDMPSPGRNGLESFDLGADYGFAVGGWSVGSLLDCDRYLNTGNSWSSRTDITVSKKWCAGFDLGSDYGFVAGDISTYRYSNIGNSWSSRVDMTKDIEWLTGFDLDPDYGFAVGGVYATIYMQECNRYSDTENSWVSRTDMPSPGRGNLASFDLGVDYGFAIGGYDGSNLLCDCDRYSDVGNSWSSRTDMPVSKRYNLTGFDIRRDYGFAVGGTIIVSGSSIRDCDRYFEISNSWSVRTDIVIPERSACSSFTL